MKKWKLIAAFLLSGALATGCNLASGTTSTDISELQAKADAAAAQVESANRASNPAPTSSGTTSEPKPTTSSSSSGSGTASGPSGGFLWKPVSDSNGNLVVLLPPSYKNVKSITVSGARSESAGLQTIANGGRPHYRFSMPGAAYGKNIKVSGGGGTWTVPDGSKRTSI